MAQSVRELTVGDVVPDGRLDQRALVVLRGAEEVAHGVVGVAGVVDVQAVLDPFGGLVGEPAEQRHVAGLGDVAEQRAGQVGVGVHHVVVLLVGGDLGVSLVAAGPEVDGAEHRGVHAGRRRRTRLDVARVGDAVQVVVETVDHPGVGAGLEHVAGVVVLGEVGEQELGGQLAVLAPEVELRVVEEEVRRVGLQLRVGPHGPVHRRHVLGQDVAEVLPDVGIDDIGLGERVVGVVARMGLGRIDSTMLTDSWFGLTVVAASRASPRWEIRSATSGGR